MSIQIEIEGVLPWKRALLTSGGKVLTDLVQEDHAKGKSGAAASIEKDVEDVI